MEFPKTQPLNLFGTTFKREGEQAVKVQNEYEERKADRFGWKSEDANVAYQRDLENVADAILQKDAKLMLRFPFTITEEIKNRLASHPDYYYKDRILEQGTAGYVCMNSGETIRSGEIYVQETGTSNVSLLKEVNESDRLVIDGESVVLKIAM